MSKYKEFREHLESIADIQGATALMHWDQEVYMPSKGAEYRSRHLATLSGLSHERFTDPEFGELLEHLLSNGKLDPDEKINVARTKEDYDKEVKLDTEFVKKRSRLVSKAYQKWIEARKEKDWNIFKEALKPLVELKREECEKRGYDQNPYQALFELYEPGMTLEKLDSVFEDLKESLLPLLSTINEHPKEINSDFLYQSIDEDKQWDWSIHILNEMGYDFDAGRQDRSPHPFTITFAPDDVRITTRVDESDISNVLYSSIHEGGHALYEQGLPKKEFYGLPLSEASSLSIHESQSRLWENHVGRSKDFWQAYYPEMQSRFPDAFGKVPLQKFYEAINIIQPNKIRTDADELHYHIHIIIRYEIEKELIAGNIEVDDLRDLWNEKYAEYLNVDIEHDNEGILQDVHWAHGGFGYFPTYTLGSLYAAQLYEKLASDVGDLSGQIGKGKLETILDWLRTNIHAHGRRYKSEDLCSRVTGDTLNVGPFIKYATKKFGKIYAIQ